MLSMIERIVLKRFLKMGSSYDQTKAYGFICRGLLLGQRAIQSKRRIETTASVMSGYRGSVPHYNIPLKLNSGFKSKVAVRIGESERYNVPWLNKELKILANALTKVGNKYLKTLPVDVVVDLLGFDELEDIETPLGYVIDSAVDHETNYLFKVSSVKKNPTGGLTFILDMDVTTFPSLRNEGLEFDFSS